MLKNIPKEVEPFKNIKDIDKIKQYLRGKDNLRDYTIFVVGINVGLRAGDLLSIKWEDIIENGKVVDSVGILEGKTKKSKEIDFNRSSKEAIQLYYDSLEDIGEYMFSSRKGDSHLQVRSLHRVINNIVSELNIKGNFGTHSLRKTFGYHRYNDGMPLETLQKVFNHSTQEMTLKYIGITREVIKNAYHSINL